MPTTSLSVVRNGFTKQRVDRARVSALTCAENHVAIDEQLDDAKDGFDALTLGGVD